MESTEYFEKLTWRSSPRNDIRTLSIPPNEFNTINFKEFPISLNWEFLNFEKVSSNRVKVQEDFVKFSLFIFIVAINL